MGQLLTFAAEKHTVVLRVGEARHKLFKVQFSRADGSLYVHVPYYMECNGIASVVTLKPGEALDTELGLDEAGKITAHRVKYSHHPDGRAHFSQDAKVVTSVERQATPLRDFMGHVFTLQIQGPDDFEAVAIGAELRRSHRAYDHLLKPTERADAYKFVGEWVGKERFKKELTQGDIGPSVAVTDDAIKPELGLLLGPEPGRPPEDRALLLTCEAVKDFNLSGGSCLLLIGGFDPVARASDINAPTSFLALLYPASGSEDLRAQLGTIDFEPAKS